MLALEQLKNRLPPWGVSDLGVDKGAEEDTTCMIDLKSSAHVTCFDENQSLRSSKWRRAVGADSQASSVQDFRSYVCSDEPHWHTHNIGSVAERQSAWDRAFWAGGDELGAQVLAHTPMSGSPGLAYDKIDSQKPCDS